MKKYAFVNVDLSDMQRVRYEDIREHADDWHSFVEEVIDLGYKVSFSKPNDGDSLVVSITDKRDDSVNSDMILSCWTDAIGKGVSDLSIVLRLCWERDADYRAVLKAMKDEMNADIREFQEYMDKKRSNANKTDA